MSKGLEMPSIKVAHLREQGQEMLLFPLSSSFGFKPSLDQNSILADLERLAHRAGLAGKAAAFWEAGGRTYFLGPRPWFSFLQRISLAMVWANVNREISY
jgi:hypothetical protein